MKKSPEKWVIIRSNPHDAAAVDVIGHLIPAASCTLAQDQVLVRYRRWGRIVVLPFAVDHLAPATDENVEAAAMVLEKRADRLRRWLKARASQGSRSPVPP